MEESIIVEFRALAKAVDAAWLKTRDNNFTQKVDEFRQVERDFIQRAGDDESFALETRRRIAEAILSQANVTNQPFNVCQDVWNELVQLGFSNIEITCAMSWFYADCCWRTKQFDVGLSVLEPLIAEFERQLADPTVANDSAEYYRYEIDRLGKLRDKIKAYQK